ncbi:MAG: type VI secretion system contractile sheath large subunit [Marinovum sp.]|nr:type VI secretion system contractile sheath large subunit [Marinovum sp.]
MEVGDALAEKTAIELDVDTIDDVIARFATTLTLPMGTEGKGIEIKLNELEDLHPDELYENVELFAAIAGLRQQLNVGSMAANTVGQLQSWSQEFGQSIKIPKRSASTSIPADRKLSDFQALIGDTTGRLTQASPAEDFIAQIVGPHVLKAPDAGAEGMKQAVDEALSGAMRMILHHPDFQALEAQWRSLDFLARRIETDSTLRIDLFDVSAEELATDLASQEELSESGLFRLLNRDLDPEDGAGGFSALFGLYTFEETPPHAELLARVAHVAAHVDAPFFAAMSPSYLETAMEDRHPLVAERWDQVRGLVDAGYLGLASPRFLLRQPYGSKSEPIDEFEFEEFTAQEGLRGMLWANPVVLVAVLLTATHKKDGKAMNLGSLMSLGDLPFFYTNDRFGDQVALPCTERNLTSDPAQATLARGYMPVVWVKGRNEVRLASFRSLGGDEILGPWAGDLPQPPPQPTPVAADVEVTLNTDGDVDDDDLDALLTGLDSGDDDDTDLDDLLAGFGDDDEGGDEDDMDADLAALLEGL